MFMYSYVKNTGQKTRPVSPAWYRQRLDGETLDSPAEPRPRARWFLCPQPVQWCSGGWRPAPVRYQDPCHQQPSVERSAPPPHHVPHPPASATPSSAAVLTRAVRRNVQSALSLAGTELGPRGSGSHSSQQPEKAAVLVCRVCKSSDHSR